MKINFFPKLNNEKLIIKGKYRNLSEFEYILPNKSIIKYEVIDPVNKKNIKYAHGVGAIPIIKQTNQLILIENFRYPINKKCIEFPAGSYEPSELDSSNEKINNNAISVIKRELKEETGYEGDYINFFILPTNKNLAAKFFGNVYHDPWKSTSSTVMTLFSVDLEKNKENKQNLEDIEMIKVNKINLDNLFDFLCDKAKDGYGIRQDLYYLTCGMFFDEIFNFEWIVKNAFYFI